MTDIKQCMRDILAHESRAVAEIPVTDGYERAVGMIVEQVWNRHGKLITSGMGKAGQIAMNIATTFASTGIPAERGAAWRLGRDAGERHHAAALEFG